MVRMKIQSAPRPIKRPDVPQDISLEYAHARETTEEEIPSLQGVLYEQGPQGDVSILKYSGETTSELPPDIPASAVNQNGRAMIYVDGIHQEITEQQRQIKYFLHGYAPSGADVDQNVIAIHEGAGKSGFRDGLRIGKVLGMLKLVQSGLVPLQWASKRIYHIDPAIKTVHDEVRQSLLAGRKVQLMTHSGGGAETATALTLLAREGMGREIENNVRVLSLASVAAHKDFVKAGVQEKNLYYTGSKNDPVYSVFRHYLSPCAIPSAVGFAAEAARYLYHLVAYDKAQETAYHYHSPDYIFASNVTDQGQPIQAFLDGGPGGRHPLN